MLIFAHDTIPAPVPPSPAETLRAGILLVDDCPENLRELAAMLAPLSCRILHASSAEELTQRLLTGHLAVILMAAHMPDKHGFETGHLVRGRDHDIPILLIWEVPEDRRSIFRSYPAGVLDYLVKPLDPDTLQARVHVFLELFEKNEQLRRQAELLYQKEQTEEERRSLERELEEERRQLSLLSDSENKLSRFKATVDASLDCVRMFDPDTLLYTYVNQGTLNQLGYGCEEMMKLSPVDIAVDRDESEFRGRLAALIDGSESALRYETLHRRKDGSVLPVSVSVQFVRIPGEKGRFISVVHDISEQKKAQEILVQARDDAERANRARSEFISSVSHELRTPLNSIIGFSKLLFNPRVGELNENQHAYLHDVLQSAEQLLRTVNDILDISKIEAGRMKLELSEFSLADLLNQSAAILRETAITHNLEIMMDIPTHVKETAIICADQRKIRQVMFNLLSNAIKFTPDGGTITIRARLCNAEAENWHQQVENPPLAMTPDSLVVSVSDTGIGIAPENKARVFGAFEQVDNSYTRRQQGTGLGLSLTKKMVEMHGGLVWLESEPGKGSTFSFSVPFRAAVAAKDDAESGAKNATNLLADSGGASTGD